MTTNEIGLEKVEVYVYDCVSDSTEDCAPYQVFYIVPKDLSQFLRVCKENYKYVEVRLNYQLPDGKI